MSYEGLLKTRKVLAHPSGLHYKVEYIGVTEADLQLSIKNIEIPLDFQLFRNDSLINQGQEYIFIVYKNDI